ncbi:anthranilate synthase component I [Pseudactinotalea sp. HY160]|uniref:anthranilate synthase component I n=1 Tax=Pseudactinotalea sp. HY160 TaxID=2654490 RepID=UPI00128C7A8E|nr:anthranilate synthase component I [Pseudactinotalea sp. HY160]MPV49918.1 anthranilate synthase component I [Pseudactinotalea sp. HY160]
MSTLEWGHTWPSREEFVTFAGDRRVIPVVRRLLADDVTPVGLYRRLSAGRPGTFILESAETDGAWNRWSFVGVSTRATLTARDGQAAWSGEPPVSVPQSGPILDVLRGTLAALHTERFEGLPPLTGGLVGAMGWDLTREWEPTLPREAPDEQGLPDLALLLVADMVAVDHHDGSIWLIANAINTNDTSGGVEEAYDDAVRRLDSLAARVGRPAEASVAVLDPAAHEPQVRYRSTQAEFEESVRSAKRAITEGEVFQVVFSQRLDLDCEADPLDVYRALRTINPSPYMYLVHLAEPDGREFHVVGSSPETLVKVDSGRVTSFPIAGSRPRGATPAEDQELGVELLADPKERSEHLMLVDLARNDLGKVCRPGSVAVEEFMAIRRFSHIMHITSTVSGRLRADATALDAFTAAFPAGTLSGAPKPRAIELIDSHEPARRGLYGGTVGYFDFAGEMDMAIAIRTAVIAGGVATVQAGAGLVADSDPHTEYVETRNKAAAVVHAIATAARIRPV